jgi:hypothetical protein
MQAKRCFRWMPLVLAGSLVAGSALAADGAAATAPHKAKALAGNGAAVDANAPPVGVGTHMGPRATEPGIYFTDKDRRAVHEWFQSHPLRNAVPVTWAIGQPLPAGTPVQPVPTGLLGAIRKQPPGFRYVVAGNAILVVANASQLVVDGASAVQ